ncbi:MAG: hypothetical protein AMXMBFR84_42690, partial [Candidatus Hydrogenedentota bacterium]
SLQQRAIAAGGNEPAHQRVAQSGRQVLHRRSGQAHVADVSSADVGF